jgi:hypothetical protein
MPPPDLSGGGLKASVEEGFYMGDSFLSKYPQHEMSEFQPAAGDG